MQNIQDISIHAINVNGKVSQIDLNLLSQVGSLVTRFNNAMYSNCFHFLF
jgi:hypothetical protein